MNRIDRLNAILIQLQSKRVVKAQEIADRFEISLRTVYRDIRALEEGGVPIGAEAGIGYFLDDSYQLPPVMLTKSEAGALVMAGKFLHRIGDKKTQENHQSALLKIKAVLKSHDKEFLEDLESLVTVSPGRPSQRTSKLEDQLSKIQDVIPDRKVITLNYHSYYKNEHTERSVEPIGLSFYNNEWHLIAFCRLREDYRDFRLDRILNITASEETFATHNHPDLDTYFNRLAANYDLHLIKVRFSKEVYQIMDSMKHEYGWLEEKTVGNQVEMTFAHGEFNYFKRWLVMFGKDAEVVEPDELKKEMKEFAQELARHILR